MYVTKAHHTHSHCSPAASPLSFILVHSILTTTSCFHVFSVSCAIPELSPAAKARVVYFEDDTYLQLRAKISDLEEEIKKLRDKARLSSLAFSNTCADSDSFVNRQEIDLCSSLSSTKECTIRQNKFYDQLSQGILKTLEKTALENLQKNIRGLQSALASNLEASLTAAETRASDAEWKLEESRKELGTLKCQRSEVIDFTSLHDYLEDRFNKMTVSAG
ncbi:hypothetical protein IW261DRAFT_1575733 [Armillaria novae-zelandiae]|uniref:Uncharacterized protein n=1 Tax=Armillaria novae-zelandiae TaxID=153914 RepID=A0AA39NCZ5_9AGAR|nr:hypothetical protein IW261DRAFT_1575733 [Armillaria novae-zelandiae]